jgi:hypothetical protein
MPRTDTYWSAVYKSWKAVGAVDGLCIEAGRTLPGVYRCFEIHTCLSMPNRDDLNVVIDDTAGPPAAGPSGAGTLVGLQSDRNHPQARGQALLSRSPMR